MKQIKQLSILLTLGLFVSSPVLLAQDDAFEGLMMRMGTWEIQFSGNVNAFWTAGDCDGKDLANGGVAHGLACGSYADEDYGDIRDGLLPSWLNFTAKTVTDTGIKTGVHISFQPGSDTGPLGKIGNFGGSGRTDGALGQGEVNFRQVFLTMGHDDWGTFKIGRDLGVFGSDAILQDMTLLGVGGGAQSNGHTTLGRIGFGYLYADWKSQLAYTSPNWDGFSFTAAVTDPWGARSIANLGGVYSLTEATPGFTQDRDTYGFEFKANYDFDTGNDVSGKLWGGYIYQEVDGNLNGANLSNTADGWELGGKLQMGAADVVAYYYDGEGIGTTGFLIDGFDVMGEERDSDGWYLQGRYRMPTGTLFGISYGESELDETATDEANRMANAANSNLVESNELFVIGLYHPVGEGLNLVLEYSDIESEAHNGNEGEEDLIAVGAIMFF